jgi:hypothetical protein
MELSQWIHIVISIYIWLCFIHSSIKRKLTCFHLFSVVNSVSVNIGILFASLILIHVGLYLEVEWLAHIVLLCLAFLFHALFSIETEQPTFFWVVPKDFNFSISSLVLVIFSVLFVFYNFLPGWAQWFIPVIPTTEKVGIRGTMIWDQPRQKVSETPILINKLGIMVHIYYPSYGGRL